MDFSQSQRLLQPVSVCIKHFLNNPFSRSADIRVKTQHPLLYRIDTLRVKFFAHLNFSRTELFKLYCVCGSQIDTLFQCKVFRLEAEPVNLCFHQGLSDVQAVGPSCSPQVVKPSTSPSPFLKLTMFLPLGNTLENSLSGLRKGSG